MDPNLPPLIAAFGTGLVTGGLGLWLATRSRAAGLRAACQAAESERLVLEERLRAKAEEAESLRGTIANTLEPRLTAGQETITRLHGDNMALRARLDELEEKIGAERALLKEARQELTDTFKALSADILQRNSRSFLELARETLAGHQQKAKSELELRHQSIHQLVKPLQESLARVDDQLRQVEKARTEAYAGLTEQVKQLAATQARLQLETGNLARALRAPTVRGRWGEIQLRRVVELAGMVEYCDFIEQESVRTDQGRQRPDMVIKLPNGKNIVVDSKTALHAYLEATEAADEAVRAAKLREHAGQVRSHLNQLASKAYWEQFQPSPEFVVLFLPGESFFSAALEQDPKLIELGVNQRVILATPTTLIALLRAVSYGWRQERIAAHAQAIGELGRTLHDRIGVLAGHFEELRRGLGRSVDAYNRTVASFESRVLVTARKFQEIDPGTLREITAPAALDKTVRQLSEPATAPTPQGPDDDGS